MPSATRCAGSACRAESRGSGAGRAPYLRNGFSIRNDSMRQRAPVERNAGSHAVQWRQHGVEVGEGRGLVERDVGFAEHRVQALLHHLEADAGGLVCQRFADHVVGDGVLACVAGIELVGEDVGVDEEVNAHSGFVSRELAADHELAVQADHHRFILLQTLPPRVAGQPDAEPFVQGRVLAAGAFARGGDQVVVRGQSDVFHRRANLV